MEVRKELLYNLYQINVLTRTCIRQSAHQYIDNLSLSLFSWLCCMTCGILVPQPETEPGPSLWEHRVLTTGPPANSCWSLLWTKDIKARRRGAKAFRIVTVFQLSMAGTQMGEKYHTCSASCAKLFLIQCENLKGGGGTGRGCKLQRYSLFDVFI